MRSRRPAKLFWRLSFGFVIDLFPQPVQPLQSRMLAQNTFLESILGRTKAQGLKPGSLWSLYGPNKVLP
jgi:hypothetical protein